MCTCYVRQVLLNTEVGTPLVLVPSYNGSAVLLRKTDHFARDKLAAIVFVEKVEQTGGRGPSQTTPDAVFFPQ